MLGGCRGHAQLAGDEACAPALGALHGEVKSDQLVGDFALRVFTSVPGVQRTTEGTLSLRLHPDSVVRLPGYDTLTVAPLIGDATLDLEAIGAAPVGNLTSADPAAPGVLVFRRPAEITLRLGSDANRGRELKLDGAYLALFVHEVTSERFRGSWASGVDGRRTEGYFCARRLKPW
jgi:hypothetical protein